MATVTIFGGNFAPRSWMFCQGQLLSIAEYSALYALIGTTYGGDGNVSFALPDLRGRVAVHPGQGGGLSPYTLGQVGGTENVTIMTSQMPMHTHAVVSITGSPAVSSANGGQSSAVNTVPATTPTQVYTTSPDGFGLGPSISNTVTPISGGSQPFEVLAPYLVMNYIICVEGIFPSRN